MFDKEYAILLREQIETTVSQLSLKKNSLVAQIEENQHVQAELIHKKDEEKVMVYLGDGYFVEKSPTDATELIDRKIERINKSVTEFNSKINEAYSTRDQLANFHNLDNDISNSEGEVTNNEEGLPFMEIEEELDEADHIIKIKVNNQIYSPDLGPDIPKAARITPSRKIGEPTTTDYEFIKESLETDKIIPGNESIEDDDQFTELLQDMEILSTEKRLIEPFNEDQLLEKIDELKVSPGDKFKLKQMCVEEFNKLKEEIGEDSKTFPISKTTGNNAITNEISENSLDEVTGRQRRKVVADIIKDNNLFDGKEIASTSTPKKDSQIIGRDDILELELLADEFVDSETLGIDYADDEEWDFDFSDNEEDNDNDEDDISDQLLYGNYEAFLGSRGNESASKMLWEQVMNLRLDKKKKTNENSKLTSKENPNKRANSKSVRFSDTLEIKEIENISEILKNAKTPSKISRFKQDLLASNRFKTAEDEIAPKKHLENSDFQQNLENHADQLTKGIYYSKGKRIDLKEQAKTSEIVLLDRQKLMSDSILKHEDSINKEIIAKTSRFKQKILESGKQKSKDNEFGPFINELRTTSDNFDRVHGNVVENDDQEIHGDVIEKDVVSILEAENSIAVNSGSDSAVHGDIIEKYGHNDNENITELDKQYLGHTTSQITEVKRDEDDANIAFCSSTKKPVSRFKSSLIKGAKRIDSKRDSEKSIIVSADTDIGLKVDFGASGKEQEISTCEHDEDKGKDVRETTLDYQSIQNDMDTMAKAYILGMYDDDIMTEGPVVDEMSDFERLNKIVESMSQRKDTEASLNTKSKFPKKSDEFDPEMDEIAWNEDEDEDDDSDKGPLLATNIVENDISDDEDAVDIEDHIFNQELTTSYHKLRQKIIFESNELGFKMTDEEMEFEPLDECGNSIRMSRFKAARMNHT